MSAVVTIRGYQTADWPMVDAWWKASGEVGPLPGMMPLDSSFIAEIDGAPALGVALYLTNTPEVVYVENFIGNPSLKGEERKRAAHVLLAHLSEFSKSKGYKRLLCMTEKPVLMDRYAELGFRSTLSGITTFTKEV